MEGTEICDVTDAIAKSRDSTMIDASVIICAYTLDRWDELRHAIQSVRMQNPPPREIIVVIDYNAELQQRVEHWVQPGDGVTVVANIKTAGLSGGRMTGAELATAPIIVFLDDDAMAGDGWLAGLLAAYDDPRVLGAGGHIEPLWRWRRVSPSWFPPEFYWVVGCTYKGMPVRDGQVRNLIGASMSVRADVLRQTGGFTTKLGRREGGGAIAGVVAESCEETEFCIRASRLHPGGIWMYCPTSIVHHSVPTQRATWRYFVRRCWMEGTAKAVLTGLTGSRDGLGAESRYVLTLARSVLSYIATGRISRATAVCVGLTITTAAYVRGRVAGVMVRWVAKRVLNSLRNPTV